MADCTMPQAMLQITSFRSWPLSRQWDQLNNNGLQLGIYKDAHKTPDVFSQYQAQQLSALFHGALFMRKKKMQRRRHFE
jgi:hypothetical protein